MGGNLLSVLGEDEEEPEDPRHGRSGGGAREAAAAAAAAFPWGQATRASGAQQRGGKGGVRQPRSKRPVPQSAQEASEVWGSIDTTKVDVGALAPKILEAQRKIPVEEATCLQRIEKSHEEYVRVLVWDPFRDFLISGGGDGWIRLWSLEDYDLEEELNAELSVRSLLVLTRELASGHSNGEVVLWSMEDPGHPIVQSIQAHREAVYSLQMLRSGELVVGAESVKIFARDRNLAFQLTQRVQEEVLCMCVVPLPGGSDTQVAAGNMKGSIIVWDTRDDNTGAWSTAARRDGHTRSVWSMCYVRDVDRVASGSADNTIRIWNPDGWECERELRNHSGWVVGLSAGPGWLLSSSIDQTVKAWDVTRWACSRTFNDNNYEVFCCCAFTGGRFASSGAEMSIKVYGGPKEASSKGVGPAQATTASSTSTGNAGSVKGGIDMTIEGYRDQIDQKLHAKDSGWPGSRQKQEPAGAGQQAAGGSGPKGWGGSRSGGTGGAGGSSSRKPVPTAGFGAGLNGALRPCVGALGGGLSPRGGGGGGGLSPHLSPRDGGGAPPRAASPQLLPAVETAASFGGKGGGFMSTEDPFRPKAAPAASASALSSRPAQEEEDLDFETRRAVPRVNVPASPRGRAAAAAAAWAVAEASSVAEDLDFETRRAVPRFDVPVATPTPLPTMPQYRVGETAWVFSASQGQWLKARVSAVEGQIVTLIYRLLAPGAPEAKKQLLTTDPALRPASADPPSAPPPGGGYPAGAAPGAKPPVLGGAGRR